MHTDHQKADHQCIPQQSPLQRRRAGNPIFWTAMTVKRSRRPKRRDYTNQVEFAIKSAMDSNTDLHPLNLEDPQIIAFSRKRHRMET